MLDGMPADEMTQEQLVEHLGRIKEELDREREERNFFQLERDKIHTFWEITRRQLEERKAALRNKVWKRYIISVLIITTSKIWNSMYLFWEFLE